MVADVFVNTFRYAGIYIRKNLQLASTEPSIFYNERNFPSRVALSSTSLEFQFPINFPQQKQCNLAAVQLQRL